MNKLLNYLVTLLNEVGYKTLVIILAIMVFAIFIVALILAVFKRGYGIKKRAWYLFFTLGVIFALCSITAIMQKDYGVVWAFVSACAFSFVPLIAVREKKIKIKDSHRNFVKFLDNQIKNVEPVKPPERQVVERIKTERVEEEKSSVSNFHLDFKHVKSVIERLEYYGLSTADKKVVCDLQTAIEKAEDGDFCLDIKNRINDGLGALLKIMAKYGV